MTQEQIIKKRLEDTGEVSRNWALENFISRLSAIIYDLEKQGWKFSDKHHKPNSSDYFYSVVKIPTIDEVMKPYFERQELQKEVEKQETLL